jgi:hypothetical protein
MKKIPELTEVRVDIRTRSPSGRQEYAIRSNAPGAPKPAAPRKTILDAINHLTFLAAMQGYGSDAIAAATGAVQSTNAWKDEHEYE